MGCSTLKLAFDVSPTSRSDRRSRDVLKIVPNPYGQFERKDPVFTYYEVYNLAYDGQGKTNYTVSFALKQLTDNRNVLQKIVGVFGSRKMYEVSIQNDQTGDSRTVADYISFDVSRARPGQYELRLTVRDNVTGQETSAVAGLTLD